MIDPARLAQAIHGLRLLIRMEPGCLSFFEQNYNGFVRSFFPALVLAPLHFSHIALVYIDKTEKPDLSMYIITEILAYVLSWTLFAFVMMYIARSLDRAGRYFTYLVTYNWFQLVVGGIVLPLTLLVDLKLIGGLGAELVNVSVICAFLFYGTFLARIALDIATSTAFGIVLLDILLNLLSSEIIRSI
jgi:hypothetical protein